MSELEMAVADVKRQLGVESAPANEIALRLPEHLRAEFWERAVEYYLADKTALLSADEPDGLFAAAERRGYDLAVANLRDMKQRGAADGDPFQVIADALRDCTYVGRRVGIGQARYLADAAIHAVVLYLEATKETTL